MYIVYYTIYDEMERRNSNCYTTRSREIDECLTPHCSPSIGQIETIKHWGGDQISSDLPCSEKETEHTPPSDKIVRQFSQVEFTIGLYNALGLGSSLSGGSFGSELR
ncbi:hypothetical protein TMatcc_001754 [Talaromyces marneffei ATCC 18224]